MATKATESKGAKAKKTTSAKKKVTKTSTKKKVSNAKSGKASDDALVLVANTLKILIQKIDVLQDTVDRLTDINSELQDRVDELTERNDQLEKMFERSFVLAKAQEGNQQKLNKICLEILARRDYRMAYKKYSYADMIKYFKATYKTIHRWVIGDPNDPERKLRVQEPEGKGKPYFIHQEVLEDILNDRVPTNFTTSYLLDCLSMMANEVTHTESDFIEDVPEPFQDL